MDRKLYPLDYDQLAQRALDEGGFTIDLEGNSPTEGFAVSLRKDVEVTIWLPPVIIPRNVEDLIADVLYRFVIDRGHDLRNGAYFGAWRDGSRVVLDLVNVIPDMGAALKAAGEAHQEAIYDLRTGRTIRVPATWGVLNVERRERWLDDAGSDTDLYDEQWLDDPTFDGNPYQTEDR